MTTLFFIPTQFFIYLRFFFAQVNQSQTSSLTKKVFQISWQSRGTTKKKNDNLVLNTFDCCQCNPINLYSLGLLLNAQCTNTVKSFALCLPVRKVSVTWSFNHFTRLLFQFCSENYLKTHSDSEIRELTWFLWSNEKKITAQFVQRSQIKRRWQRQRRVRYKHSVLDVYLIL